MRIIHYVPNPYEAYGWPPFYVRIHTCHPEQALNRPARASRRDSTCLECGGRIMRTFAHYKIKGTYDSPDKAGYIFSAKLCSACGEAWKSLGEQLKEINQPVFLMHFGALGQELRLMQKTSPTIEIEWQLSALQQRIQNALFARYNYRLFPDSI